MDVSDLPDGAITPRRPSARNPGGGLHELRPCARALLLALAVLLGACSRADKTASATAGAAAAGEAVVNLYIWSDYLAPDTAAVFEKQTGIRLRTTYFDSLEQLETKMLNRMKTDFISLKGQSESV